MPVLMCDKGYGYQWGTSLNSTAYWAYGSYGQAIYVIPELDAVVVSLQTSQKEWIQSLGYYVASFSLPATQT
jgi:CubicO group peptidase (beta-lactamase class C family)